MSVCQNTQYLKCVDPNYRSEESLGVWTLPFYHPFHFFSVLTFNSSIILVKNISYTIHIKKPVTLITRSRLIIKWLKKEVFVCLICFCCVGLSWWTSLVRLCSQVPVGYCLIYKFRKTQDATVRGLSEMDRKTRMRWFSHILVLKSKPGSGRTWWPASSTSSSGLLSSFADVLSSSPGLSTSSSSTWSLQTLYLRSSTTSAWSQTGKNWKNTFWSSLKSRRTLQRKPKITNENFVSYFYI